jgi:hypothetical protein
VVATAFVPSLRTSPVRAATDGDIVAYIADDAENGTYGVYWSSADGSSRHTVIADNDIRDVAFPALSPRGDRIAFEYDANGAGMHAIAVVNLDGSGLRTLVPAPSSIDTSVGVPSWSPSGKYLLYTVRTVDSNGSTYRLRTVTTTGEPVIANVDGGLGLGWGSYDPANAGEIVAASASGSHPVVLLRDGVRTTVPGTSAATFPRLSPGGDRIVYMTGSMASSHIVVTGRDGSGSVTVASTGVNEYPTWSTDATSVYFDELGATGMGDLMTAPADGSSAPVAVPTVNRETSDELAPTIAGRDASAPATPGDVTVRLAGPHPVVSWHNPSDADFSHVVVRRGLGDAPTSWSTVYSGRRTSVTDAVRTGRVYTYTVTAFDSMGNTSAAVDRSMRALVRPVVKLPAVVASSSTAPSFGVSWGGPGNPTGTRYHVDVSARRRGSTSAWTSFRDGAATSATYSPSGSVAGTTYHFRATVRDGYGNRSVATYATATEPYDDRAASYAKGWRSSSSQPHRWLGTLHTTRTSGASLTITVSGNRYYVFGDRCSSCGSLRIYVNGVYKTTISTHASTLQPRRLLWTSAAMSRAVRKIRIVNVGTAGHAQIHVDAVAGAL